MDAEALLSGLNEAQTRAVTSPAQPLCILAGAGSGKTRVLTRRIAHRAACDDLEPRHVLAVTFTRKAAGELTRRLRDLGLRESVAAGTFHAVAYAQLRARWADRNIRPPSLLERKAGFVARLLPAALLRRGVSALDFVTEIEWAKARMLGHDDYTGAATLAGRRVSTDYATVAEVFGRYERTKRERRMVDFDDLLRLCRRDLLDDREFAATQHWRFRHFFVDEFQDVNPLQQALLRAWLGERRDLCVVGDPNQAIYAWNGADATYLVDFDRYWPGGASVRLVDNYRSTPQVLRTANAVLRAAAGAHAEVAALVPHRPDGPEPTVTALTDDMAEAAAVARQVRDRHRPGGRWARQAVLVRTNAQLALIERALRAGGIPYRIRGGGALLDQPEVRTALQAARRHKGTFDALIAEIDGRAQRHTGAPAGAGPGGDDDGLAPTDEELAADGRAANLEALARLARDYRDLGGAATVPGFLAWLADFARADLHDPGGDAVDLLTFHAAKGLEWSVVHLAGLEEGLVPISHAKTAAAQAEERRLFYVAVTRAQEELHCTWAEQRTFRERPATRRRSPFLDEVERRAARARADRRVERRDGDRGVPPPPRPTSPPPPDVAPGDRAVFEALRSWRAGLARGALTPVRVIASDETLKALAAHRPATLAELAAIPGLGPSKVARYGEALLDLVAERTADTT